MIYVFKHYDTPDSQDASLTPTNCETITEAIKQFEEKQRSDLEDASERHIQESGFHSVSFIDARDVQAWSWEDFSKQLIAELSGRVDKKKEEAERKEFDRLKKKFGGVA